MTSTGAVKRGFALNKAGNYAQSLCWYTLATNLGDPAGVQGLAYAYDKGQGVKKDSVKAFRLDLIAAEQGNMYAQADLAQEYESGIGTEKNTEKAAYWLDKANAQAQAIRDRRAQAMAQEQQSERPLLFLQGLVQSVIEPLGPHPPRAP